MRSFAHKPNASAKRAPTAVNLAWAVDRVLHAEDALQEARAIHDEQIVIDEAIARHGIELFAKNARVMTLCNTGPLATAAGGTAAGAIIAAQRAGQNRTPSYVKRVRCCKGRG